MHGWRFNPAGPTAFGWIEVLLYVAVAALCWRNSRLATPPARLGPAAFFRARTQRRVWCALALVILLLAINKLIDLQTWITLLGRQTSEQEGWYSSRRGIQSEAVIMIALGAISGCAILATLARRAGVWSVFAVCATVALTAFIVVRAISLHHIDAILNRGWGPVTINRVVEIGALALDGALAWLMWRQLSRERPSK